MASRWDEKIAAAPFTVWLTHQIERLERNETLMSNAPHTSAVATHQILARRL